MGSVIVTYPLAILGFSMLPTAIEMLDYGVSVQLYGWRCNHKNQHIWCQQILRAPHCQTRCLFSIVFKYVQDVGLVSDTKTLQNCTPQIWTRIDVDFPGLASHCGQSESEFILQDLAVCGPVSQNLTLSCPEINFQPEDLVKIWLWLSFGRRLRYWASELLCSYRPELCVKSKWRGWLTVTFLFLYDPAFGRCSVNKVLLIALTVRFKLRTNKWK